MKKLIVLADWADDSLTTQEFRSALEGYVKNPDGINVSFVSSTPSTIHTGFLLLQIALTEERYGRPLDAVIFQNTDPRIHTMDSSEGAKGADLLILRLTSGIYVCGPNAGYDYSLIKDKIDEAFIYRDMDKGSQFRSRDLYSRVSAHLMDALEDEMELDEISTNAIPGLDHKVVGHIDNYGNIKTTLTLEDLKGKYEFEDEVEVTINNITKKARFTHTLFGGVPGELVIYPGSSGHPDNPFVEISIWRHFTEENPTTGKDEFKGVKPGMEIRLSEK